MGPSFPPSISRVRVEVLDRFMELPQRQHTRSGAVAVSCWRGQNAGAHSIVIAVPGGQYGAGLKKLRLDRLDYSASCGLVHCSSELPSPAGDGF